MGCEFEGCLEKFVPAGVRNGNCGFLSWKRRSPHPPKEKRKNHKGRLGVKGGQGREEIGKRNVMKTTKDQGGEC